MAASEEQLAALGRQIEDLFKAGNGISAAQAAEIEVLVLRAVMAGEPMETERILVLIATAQATHILTRQVTERAPATITPARPAIAAARPPQGSPVAARRRRRLLAARPAQPERSAAG